MQIKKALILVTAIENEIFLDGENTAFLVDRTVTLFYAHERGSEIFELVYHRYRSRIASAIDGHTLTAFVN